MGIEKHKIAVATTGSAGSATGTAVLALPASELVAVFLDFNASAPSTTDTTLKAIGGDLADITVLTVTNSATDGWYFPGEQMDDNAAAAITGAYQHPLIHQNLSIDLAQADALSPCLTAYVFVRV
tara:strand:+ start:6840 stop:7214 length:375 start_codon:yes stop_codon:yes gene_type:complete